MMRCVTRSCSSLTLCSCRCVDRGCSKTLHTRRSEYPIFSCTSSTARHFFAGLKSFLLPLPSISSCQSSDPPPPTAIGCSPPPVPSIVWLGRLSALHTPFAICDTLHHSPPADASLPRLIPPLPQDLCFPQFVDDLLPVCFCLLIHGLL